ncbi:hypothetical protein EJD97_002212 [Solanum chilense]|uniref:Zinc finger, CCHC-type n=1 Tax=Solanum chilense TaxID=4083 RepID=A0A6N2ANS2_SOLCI|nr:hypothetical protein EJD97_002212 [Solanum chilense]
MTNSSQVNVGIVSAATVSAATTSVAHNRSNVALAPAEKAAKFSGVDFKRWQHKMFFYLTTLSLERFINENVPIMPGDTPPEEQFLKYKTEDVGMKKFIVAKFLDSKMIDSKTVVNQVQELHVIIHDLVAEGINFFNACVTNIKFFLNPHIIFNVRLIVNDVFQVAAIIEKLPPLWKDFKNYLKHKRKEMIVEDLIIRLRIEEENKTAEKR